MKNCAKTFIAYAVALSSYALSSIAPTQAAEPWRHGIVQAKSDAGIVLMADHKGFAKQNGVDLNVLQFTGDSLALKALIAGELDSYEGSPGGPLLAASRGADIKIVGCYWPGLTYAIFSKPAITSVQDLAGKTLAISGPGSLPDLIARAVLQANDLPSSSVSFTPMGSDVDRMRALTTGVVDAAAASTEFIDYAKENNIKLLAHAQDVAPNFLRFCTYTTSKVITERKGELAHYLASQMQGVQYALEHRDESIALTKSITKADANDKRAADMFDEVAKYHAVDPTMAIPVEKLSWMQDLLIKTKNLKTPNDLSKLVDDSARQQALTLVSKQ
jgi:NitT/TauT family transport system substrate-binding protein